MHSILMLITAIPANDLQLHSPYVVQSAITATADLLVCLRRRIRGLLGECAIEIHF